jgi:hypothetical protein
VRSEHVGVGLLEVRPYEQADRSSGWSWSVSQVLWKCSVIKPPPPHNTSQWQDTDIIMLLLFYTKTLLQFRWSVSTLLVRPDHSPLVESNVSDKHAVSILRASKPRRPKSTSYQCQGRKQFVTVTVAPVAWCTQRCLQLRLPTLEEKIPDDVFWIQSLPSPGAVSGVCARSRQYY